MLLVICFLLSLQMIALLIIACLPVLSFGVIRAPPGKLAGPWPDESRKGGEGLGDISILLHTRIYLTYKRLHGMPLKVGEISRAAARRAPAPYEAPPAVLEVLTVVHTYIHPSRCM